MGGEDEILMKPLIQTSDGIQKWLEICSEIRVSILRAGNECRGCISRGGTDIPS